METGNFNVMERLGLQFPVSEFEPRIPDSTTFVGNWEFQRHGISRGLGLQFRNSGISIPSPPLHCRLTNFVGTWLSLLPALRMSRRPLRGAWTVLLVLAVFFDFLLGSCFIPAF
jgi:hypothetical protein